MKKKWSLFLVLFFGIFFCFEKGLAFQIEKTESKSDGHFVVHPVKVDFEVNPGQTREFELIVVNRIGRRSKFFVKEEFYKNINLLPIEKDWLEIETRDFFLEDAEKITLKIKITIPENIGLGGRYLNLIVGAEKISNSSEKTGQIELVSQIKIPLLCKIGFSENLEQISVDFNTQKRNKFFLSGPIEFSTRILNEGNVHLKARGNIDIFNLLGVKIAQLPLNTKMILPGEEEEVKTQWKKKLLIGIYDAKLNVYYGEGKFLQAKKKFIVFPIHWFILIILIIWLIYRKIKKLIEKYKIKFVIVKKNDN